MITPGGGGRPPDGASSGSGWLDLGWLGGAMREAQTLGDRLLDRHLSVAVTGLRRSGKTVFTTALIHHLLEGHTLPFLEAVHEDRYLGARLLDVPGGERFPFESFEAELKADPPRWPQATERLTRLKLEIRFRTTSWVAGYVQPTQRLFLEIIDYPGEWLLDLPLLRQGFETFSELALAMARRPPRAEAAEEWLARLDALDPSAPVDDAALDDLIEAYRRYLERCQRELGLSLVQPGRMLKSGDARLDFTPLPPGPAPEGSLRAWMRARFERYRDEVIKPFYDEHFSRFDRQIVLVDLLSSLNAGPEHFDDTRKALELILESFAYGQNSWLSRLFSPRIERVLFAASKADHVATNQHPNLKQLLHLMIAPARRAARFEGIRQDTLALAALRCTDTVRTEHQGQVLSCVRGRLKDEARETVLFPGEIPPDLPSPEDWRSGRFRFRAFAPRPLREGAKDQHIRLDQAIAFLIGDKLA